MSGYIGKATNGDREVVGRQAQAEREEMWGAIPGEVSGYDAKTQTAKVKPLFKPVYNGKKLEMPDLYEVPIEFPRTGNSAITSPIPDGTRVMLRPTMRTLENYDEEDNGTPSDRRSFHLSDMRATIIGGDSLSKPLPNVDPDNTHIRFDAEGKFGLRGSPDGKFKIEGNQGNVYALITDAIDLTQSGFDYLSTEPELVHTAEYADIANQLAEIVGKLRAMAL